MLQLNQLGNPKDERDIPEIYYWAQLFKAKTWEEIQMLAEKNECIKQSIVTLQELTADGSSFQPTMRNSLYEFLKLSR